MGEPRPNKGWNRLPAVLRAIVIGMVILVFGQLPAGLIALNLKLAPEIPWFLAFNILWLWFFWRYLNGWGWPASTSAVRKQDLRANTISSEVWILSMLAGVAGLISVMGLIFVISHHTALPEEAYQAPAEFTAYPLRTKVCIFLSMALTAGVVEEAAFRGYMLSIIQRRHGWLWGILVSSVLFYVVHLSHAYATLSFLPFFLLYSFLHGYLVYLTGSILLPIVLHFVGDFTVLPMQYGVIADAGKWPFVHNGWLSLLALMVAVPLFYKLSRFSRSPT